MGDLIRAANDIANYVNNPSSDAARKLAEESLEKNVGTSKEDYEALQKIFVGTGTLPELAVIEHNNGNFHDDDGVYSQAEFQSIADNKNNSGLTRLAANMSYDWYQDINKVNETNLDWLDPLVTKMWNGLTDRGVDIGDMTKFAEQSKEAELKSGYGFGENRRVDNNLSTNVEYDKSLDQSALLAVIGNSAQSPAQRLQAAFALHQKGQDSFTIPDGTNGDINVKISTDRHGNIGLFANEGGKTFVLMRGVYRDGSVSQQAGVGYFGDKWQKLHPGTVFTP